MIEVNRATQAFAVIALAVCWAFNWPMMKIGLTVVEPWTYRAFMLIVGGAGCLLVARIMGVSLVVPRADWAMLAALSLLQGTLWNGFSGFGIAAIDAGRASILAFTMPLWATLLSIWFLGETVTRRRVLGLVLGLVGMVLLMLPALDALGRELTGSVLMIAAALSWAAATVVFKAAGWHAHVLTITGWHFIIGGIPVLAGALVAGEPGSLLDVDTEAALAMAFSVFVAMIFCQVVWFEVVRSLPANLASMGTLCIPVLGVFFSNLVLGERVGVLEILALIVVVGALTLILPGFSWRAIRHRRQASRPG